MHRIKRFIKENEGMELLGVLILIGVAAIVIGLLLKIAHDVKYGVAESYDNGRWQ